MLQKEFAEFVITATNEAIRESLPCNAQMVEAKVKALVEKKCGKRKEIEDPQTFDCVSYCQFKVVAKYLKDETKRLEFTRWIGKRIYDKIKKEQVIETSGNPDDTEGMKVALEKINQYFQRVGYVSNSYIRWDIFDIENWKTRGEGNFAYFMLDPVILPSAKRLFREERFPQHFSSRTLENALKEFNVEGRETKDFDPTKFKLKDVEELWQIRKITLQRNV